MHLKNLKKIILFFFLFVVFWLSSVKGSLAEEYTKVERICAIKNFEFNSLNPERSELQIFADCVRTLKEGKKYYAYCVGKADAEGVDDTTGSQGRNKLVALLRGELIIKILVDLGFQRELLVDQSDQSYAIVDNENKGAFCSFIPMSKMSYGDFVAGANGVNASGQQIDTSLFAPQTEVDALKGEVQKLKEVKPQTAAELLSAYHLSFGGFGYFNVIGKEGLHQYGGAGELRFAIFLLENFSIGFSGEAGKTNVGVLIGGGAEFSWYFHPRHSLSLGGKYRIQGLNDDNDVISNQKLATLRYGFFLLRYWELSLGIEGGLGTDVRTLNSELHSPPDNKFVLNIVPAVRLVIPLGKKNQTKEEKGE